MYRVQVIIGNADPSSPNYPKWETLFYQGDLETTDDGGRVLDGLTASWDSDPLWFPSQPDPSTLRMSLWEPNPSNGPRVFQGQEISVIVHGHDADTSKPAFLSWHGRMSDVEASPFGDGIAYDMTCVDHRAALSEQRIGDEPWPAESAGDRFTRIVAASQTPPQGTGLPWSQVAFRTGGMSPFLKARDIDAVSTWDALKDTLDDAARWIGYTTLDLLPFGGVGAEPFARWTRPIVVQRTAFGETTFQLGYVSGGQQTVAALPYEAYDDGGAGFYLMNAAGLDTKGTEACIVSAGVVERAVRWRQDKAAHPNAVRLEGEFVTFNLVTGAEVSTASYVVERREAVERRGRVEQSRSTRVSTKLYAEAIANMYLGPTERTEPRWSMDAVTIRVTDIAHDDGWPRLFDPATPVQDANAQGPLDHPALGRFVLLQDIYPNWDLSSGPDYAGVLVGADISIQGGDIRAIARVRPIVPGPNGVTTGGITLSGTADVQVGSPTIAGMASTPLTIADMALVRDPSDP